MRHQVLEVVAGFQGRAGLQAELLIPRCLGEDVHLRMPSAGVARLDADEIVLAGQAELEFAEVLLEGRRGLQGEALVVRASAQNVNFRFPTACVVLFDGVQIVFGSRQEVEGARGRLLDGRAGLLNEALEVGRSRQHVHLCVACACFTNFDADEISSWRHGEIKVPSAVLQGSPRLKEETLEIVGAIEDVNFGVASAGVPFLHSEDIVSSIIAEVECIGIGLFNRRAGLESEVLVVVSACTRRGWIRPSSRINDISHSHHPKHGFRCAHFHNPTF